MLNKGLCMTCAYDKTCIFLRRFPVLHCEEFSGDGLNGKPKLNKLACCGRNTRIEVYAREESMAE